MNPLVKRILYVAAAAFDLAACSGAGGSGSAAPDTTCDNECAAMATVTCPGAPSESACVASCKSSRSAMAPACLSADAAYRECFVGAGMFCQSGSVVIVGCQAEDDALLQCIDPAGPGSSSGSSSGGSGGCQNDSDCSGQCSNDCYQCYAGSCSCGSEDDYGVCTF